MRHEPQGVKKMVNIGKNSYLPKGGNATIVKVDEGTARELLPKERIESFKKSITYFPDSLKTDAEKEQYREDRLDEFYCMLTLQVENSKITWTQIFKYPRPTPRGYKQSALIKISKRYKLPDDTLQWVGKTVEYIMNGDFPKISIEDDED